MSFQAMTWAVDQDLLALQKLVLLMLANCSNHHTGQCNPSHDRLAKECGMSKASVRRALAELEKKGLIEIRRQVKDGVNLPNQYTLRVGSQIGVVGADSTYEVGADSTEGGCSQHGGVCSDRTTKQEVKPGSKPKTNTRASRFDAQAHLVSLGVDPQIAKDWLSTRKRKKLESTLTAMERTQAEVLKSGMSINEVLRECCARGWGGFKASWLTEQTGRMNAADDPAFARNSRGQIIDNPFA